MLSKCAVHDMMAHDTVRKLKERYPNIHQTNFVHSLERATSLGHLFDLLDTFPTEFPVVWDNQCQRWVTSKGQFPR